MEELSSRDKVLKAGEFLKVSPPGEIDDVFNDIRGLVNDDLTLQQEIGPILSECNTSQFHSTTLPDSDSQVILTKYNQLNDSEFIDFQTGMKFSFDHLRMKTSDAIDYNEHLGEDEFRDELYTQGEEYLSEHFVGGKLGVFPINKELFPIYSESPDTIEAQEGYVICIINNKYSPENFYNGRWQATWVFDSATNTLTGHLKINIHYYEDGNVQLNVEKKVVEQIEDSSSDLQQLSVNVFTAIKKLEKQIQLSINENYQTLSESTFKDLRRKLPLTRSKIDWLKIANYNIGEQLGNINH
ncbi:F-actin-capping protein subunit alpha-1 [Smittium culicis]|uniref:F-actin-capping protein subunit alpha n=1 Tax=Smittium culicis TaxID=133412 RepID=A0A1R1Y0P2_9FUNG|nr:F-actin-capping protein subunit alpha-1 [Smittium culicis]